MLNCVGVDVQQGQENSQKDSDPNQPPKPKFGAVMVYSVPSPWGL